MGQRKAYTREFKLEAVRSETGACHSPRRRAI